MIDLAWFTQAFGAAVSDVRAKLVDEAFWGRKQAWSDRPQDARSHEQEPELTPHNPWDVDRGIDR